MKDASFVKFSRKVEQVGPRVTRRSRTLEYQPLRLEFLKELSKFVDTVIGDIEEKLREYFKLDVIKQTLRTRTFGE